MRRKCKQKKVGLKRRLSTPSLCKAKKKVEIALGPNGRKIYPLLLSVIIDFFWGIAVLIINNPTFDQIYKKGYVLVFYADLLMI